MAKILADYAPLFSLLGIVVLVAIWHTWAFRLRPLFIPKSEINEIVDDLIARHGPEAEDMACAEEERVWTKSDVSAQGKWRRVRRELWRRYEAGEWE